MTSVLAVDLGGTKTAAAFVDADGVAVDKQKVPAQHSLDGTVAHIAARAVGARIDAVGVIVPGIYNACTGNAWAPNLWGADEVPLRDALEQRLGTPVRISSDRTGCVLGEQWLGVARGLNDVLFVAIGTGIGVGILAGGRVIEGAHGIAGAAGWMAVSSEWKPDYARCGCWESEAAGPAIACHAGLASAEAVISAARAGDRSAVETVAGRAEFLALGLANLISIFDPEMVVLGGGLMQAGDLFIDAIRSGVVRWAQPIAVRHTRIELTQLGEDAGLLGAARLAFIHGDLNVSEKILPTNS